MTVTRGTHQYGLMFLNSYATIEKYKQIERGQWAFYYTSPKSFIIMFSYSLALKTLVNFDLLAH